MNIRKKDELMNLADKQKKEKDVFVNVRDERMNRRIKKGKDEQTKRRKERMNRQNEERKE